MQKPPSPRSRKRRSPGAGAKSPRVSMKDQVYDRIRTDIMVFELKPGERISESQLAERLGVGLASVRAVLPKLVQEGFLLNRRRLGHVVAPITMQEIRNVCQLREILEPEAADLACKRVDIAHLEEIDARSKATVEPGDRAAEIDSLMANREFHIAIAAATGNQHLEKWVAQLQDFSIRFQYLLRHSEALSEDWEHSHEPIIDALRQRDGAVAREAMEEHLRRGRMHLIQSVLELPTMQDVNIGDIGGLAAGAKTQVD